MKKLLRLLSLLLVLSLGLSMGLSCAASAAFDGRIAPYSNAYISSMYAYLSKSGSTLTVTFTVWGTGLMSAIGASRIYIYESDGSHVKTFYSASTPSMMTYNDSSYTSSVSYDGAESGVGYYAVVTGYARDNTGSDTMNYTTNTVK